MQKRANTTYIDGPMIHVGASKESIDAVKDALMCFINCTRSDEVVISAMRAFTDTCKVSNVTISHCNFQQGSP